MMEKLDLKKEHKAFYNSSALKPVIVEVPKFQYLMMDGCGAPGGDNFQKAVAALFGVSYKVKFASKQALGNDYVVMPLEGLWWADDMEDFVKGNRERWRWTLMMLQPDFITPEMIGMAIQATKDRENEAALALLRLDSYEEGWAAQIMHIGSFAEEHPNIMKLHELIAAQGGKFDGKVLKHHEIYLSDFRKVAPEKLKTVLRQPFGK
ncbi:MAG TPA: GyrI-like domain-containing protein [Bacillota bacterium]|nr:GyrI-like domain-containing protein [Bacillota bacterium]